MTCGCDLAVGMPTVAVLEQGAPWCASPEAGNDFQSGTLDCVKRSTGRPITIHYWSMGSAEAMVVYAGREDGPVVWVGQGKSSRMTAAILDAVGDAMLWMPPPSWL